MNKDLQLVITIANGFKDAWDMDFPGSFPEINEMQQTELAMNYPNLFDAIIGIMEFAQDDENVSHL